jgi:hypothetical protein
MRNYSKILVLGISLVLLHAVSGQAQFIVNNGIVVSNSTTLTTTGDWTSDAGSLLINNGAIKTSGAFVNNGVLDASSAGGFEIDVAGQLLAFKPGGASVAYLSKLGSGQLTLTGTIHIKDSLQLIAGKIVVAQPDTIVLTKGTLVASTGSSHIEGLIAYANSSGDLFFPLGKDGYALPLTIFKVQSPKVAATVVSAPTEETAGPGVDALFNFPYAWQVDKKASTDTSAYVQISYPGSQLPKVENPIITRIGADGQHTSMGARLIEDDETTVTIRSYSRGLKGLFGVAQGFPGDPVTDSLALVALYEGTGGSAWTDNGSWLTGDVDTWFGVTKTGQTITQVSLNNNNLTGNVPDQLVDILGLQTINFAQNELTSIPDFTANTEILSLDVSENKLTFASLEPNAQIEGLHYINQSKFGTAFDSLVAVHAPYVLQLDAGGTATAYQWKLNGQAVVGAAANSLELDSMKRSNMGEYVLEATNPTLPALTLTSEPQNILAYATISGTLKATVDEPATAGTMTLYKIQPAAFEKLEPVEIESDGSFLLDKVILADYQLLGFADTLLHVGSIPTYYMNTFLWEEADTLFVNDNIENLEIVTTKEPAPSTGKGSITGVLLEDDGTGRTGEVLKPKKVEGAGVSARRVERGGRGKEEVEILTLVSYVFTDVEGQFNLTNLPEGEYRLNIQYPGYPMDPNSFITITIGSALESQVGVEANVIDGKINVRKLTITGIYESEGYQAELYPNPAVDYIYLKFGRESLNRQIVMTDIQGRTLISENVAGKEEKISVQGFKNGIYLLQILEKGKLAKTLKVSIE